MYQLVRKNLIINYSLCTIHSVSCIIYDISYIILAIRILYGIL